MIELPAPSPDAPNPMSDGDRRILAEAMAGDPMPLDLPPAPAVADLIDAIGETPAVILCRRLGGLSFNIGAPAELLVDIIGRDCAEAMRTAFGSGRIYIPRKLVDPEERRQAVIALARDGTMTRQQIASSMRISERRVYTILEEARAAGEVGLAARSPLKDAAA